ncbi:MAG: transporter substrate-binding domain-containing protein [Bacteroidales bacterium]
MNKLHFVYTVLLIFCLISFKSFAYQPYQQDTTESILVGCEIDYPPYCFENEDNEADGFSVDLFRAAAVEMGIDVEFQLGTWDELKNALANGEIDALPLVGRTPEREEIFDFTFPYLTMHGAIVVRDNETDIASIDDLTGKQVAVMKGDNAEEFLYRINLDADITSTTTFKDALMQLSEGEYDAVVIQRLTALHLIEENDIPGLRVVSLPSKALSQSFCFAVNEGNSRLLGLLNEGLSVVNANRTYDKLHSHWFGPRESMQAPQKRIIIGGDYNYPPYEYLDENGQTAGFNVELTKAIAEEIGMKVEIQLGPWTEIREKLNKGHIDALQGIFYTPERDETFDMTPGHTNISYVIVSREDITLPEDLKDLKGQKFLVQKGDVIHDHASKAGLNDDAVPVETQQKALEMVSAGEYDYAVTSRALTYYLLENNGLDNLRTGKNNVLNADYCYGVKEGNTLLLSALSEGLSAIKATGEYREIYEQHLGIYEEPKFSFIDSLKYSLYVLIPLLVFLLASLTWSRMLNKKVQERTGELEKEVNERKNAEEKLHELNKELIKRNEEIADQNDKVQEKNAELEQINKELEKAKQKAEESDKLKSAFLANMSHEIRTPMNGVMGFAELLKRPQLDGEEKNHYIELIQKSGHRMLEIINNLFDISSIEAGQVEIHKSETNVNEILDELFLMFKPLAQEEKLSLTVYQDLPWKESLIITDGTKLSQILMNLINNALKYTKEGKIDFGYTLENEAMLFYVKDTGIGIPKKFHSSIFDRFVQGELAIAREYEGAGLGLSISKAYVEMLGGKIWVDSIPSQGSNFYFNIPYIPAEEEQVQSQEPAQQNERKPLNIKILVAEDDEISYRLLCETLRTENVEIIHAQNGQQAVEMVKDYQDIDIVLMDIKMPVMNGYTATQEIKKIRPDLPVIAQTAYAATEDRQKSISSGCDAYLSKPVDSRELMDMIGSFTE